MEVQLGVDMEGKAISTFKRNFPHARVLQAEVEDLSEQMDESVDEIKSGQDDKWSAMIPFVTQLIAAGPSCKGFSTANPYRANAKHTENYFTILSIIAYLMPAYVVIENGEYSSFSHLDFTSSSSSSKVFEESLNLSSFFRSVSFHLFPVPSLVNSKIGNEPNVYFKLILSILISLGYQVTFGNIIASELGVPQSRARLFFLCTKRGLPIAKLPEATYKIGPKSRGKILMGDADEKKDRDPLTFELFKTERIKAPFPLVNFEDTTSDLPSKVVPIEQGEKKMRYASVPQNSFQRLMRGDRRGPNSNLLARLDDVEEEKERIANQLLSDHTSRHPSSSSATASSSTTKRGPRILPDSRRVVENLQKGPLKPEQIDESGRLKFYQTPHQPNNEHYRFTRVDPNTPTPTWTSQNQPESHRAAPAVHPYENRLVSDAEAKRVHSFPDSFKFQEGLNPRENFRLLGQAVPPLVAKAIGESIVKANKEAIRLGLWNDSIDEQKKLILEISEFGEKVLEKELNKPLGNRSSDVDDFEEVSDGSSEAGQGSQNGQAEDLEELDMMDVDVNDHQGQVNEDEEMQMDEAVEDRRAAADEHDGEEAQEVLMML